MAFPKIGYRSIIPTASSLTATSEVSGFPIANIKDFKTYNHWKATSLSAQDIDIDMGSAATADYIGLAGHNLAAESVTLNLKADSTTPPTTVRATIVPSDYPSSGVFVKEFTSQNLRYWRISLSAASTNAVFIGLVYLGQILTSTEYLVGTLDPNVEEVESSIEQGETGYALGAVTRTVKREFSLDIGPAGAEWTTLFSPANMINDFWKTHARKLRPFFFHPNIASPTFFEAMLLVATPNARIDRPPIGGRYAQRGLVIPVRSAIAEAA